MALTDERIDKIMKRVNNHYIVYVFDKGRIRDFTGLKCNRYQAKVFVGTERRIFAIDRIYTTQKECFKDAEEKLISDLAWDLNNGNRTKIKRSMFDLINFWIVERF